MFRLSERVHIVVVVQSAGKILVAGGEEDGDLSPFIEGEYRGPCDRLSFLIPILCVGVKKELHCPISGDGIRKVDSPKTTVLIPHKDSIGHCSRTSRERSRNTRDGRVQKGIVTGPKDDAAESSDFSSCSSKGAYNLSGVQTYNGQ